MIQDSLMPVNRHSFFLFPDSPIVQCDVVNNDDDHNYRKILFTSSKLINVVLFIKFLVKSGELEFVKVTNEEENL